MKNQEDRLFKISIVVILILSLFLYKSCHNQGLEVSKNNTLTSMEDSLKVWKDKEGNFKAQISSIEATNTKYFTSLTTSNAENKKLQALVLKYEKQLSKKGSATIITTDADISITQPNAVFRDSVRPCDPTYESEFEIMGTGKYEKTRWVWGVVTSTKDSTQLGMRFHEEIDVVIGEEKTGFLGLGKPKVFAEVTLHNPFNKVSTLKSYSTVPPPVKRFGIGPVVAYGVGVGFTPQVFVGIGINWNLIKL